MSKSGNSHVSWCGYSCYVFVDLRCTHAVTLSVRSSTSADEALYTEEDLAKSMSRIECLNYHEVVYHKGKTLTYHFWEIHGDA